MPTRSRSKAPDVLTIKGAAALLGVSEMTLRRWDESGRFCARLYPHCGKHTAVSVPAVLDSEVDVTLKIRTSVPVDDVVQTVSDNARPLKFLTFQRE